MKKQEQSNKKDLIMSSALKVMSEKGYYGSTMDDIVAESRMSKGAIYHYYKSKKEVYLSLVNHWVKNYNSGFIENLEKHSTASAQLKGLFDLKNTDNHLVGFPLLLKKISDMPFISSLPVAF